MDWRPRNPKVKDLWVSRSNRGVKVAGNTGVNIQDSVLSSNSVGVETTGASSVARLSNCGVYDSTTGISAVAGQIATGGNNKFARNGTNGTFNGAGANVVTTQLGLSPASPHAFTTARSFHTAADVVYQYALEKLGEPTEPKSHSP